MSEPDDVQQLPVGAREIHLGPTNPSESLARHLLESGASDTAVDAAGGPGTAKRLRRELAGLRAA
jgi:hypothetical protein